MSLHPEQQDRINGLFAAIDAMDIDRFLACLTTDASFRFGSSPAATGHDEIRAAVGGFFETIGGLSHAISAAFSSDETLVCEGEVTYTRHDGSTITLPFADVFEYDDNLIADYKIYMDIGPLYAG